jgi:hypothetical protein
MGVQLRYEALRQGFRNSQDGRDELPRVHNENPIRTRGTASLPQFFHNFSLLRGNYFAASAEKGRVLRIKPGASKPPAPPHQ